MEEKKGMSLVRPGDILDAADSTDLASALHLANTQRINERAEEKNRVNLSHKDTAAIRTRYFERAKSVYEDLWGRCKSSISGHDFVGIDTGSRTLHQCQTCGFAACNFKKPAASSLQRMSDWKSATKSAEGMNKEMISALSKQMMALDEEAGLLEWPKPDNYIGRERTKLGRRRK